MALEQPVTQPSPGERSDNRNSHRHDAEDQGRFIKRNIADTNQECRHPLLKSAQGKRVHGQTQSGAHKRGISQKTGKGRTHFGYRQRIGFSAFRLRQDPENERQQKTGDAGHHERSAPAKVGAQKPS